jgi:hypothetical protein
MTGKEETKKYKKFKFSIFFNFLLLFHLSLTVLCVFNPIFHFGGCKTKIEKYIIGFCWTVVVGRDGCVLKRVDKYLTVLPSNEFAFTNYKHTNAFQTELIKVLKTAQYFDII